MSLFRKLGKLETQEFKQWARDNHVAGQPINPAWHPVVRAECARIDMGAETQKVREAQETLLDYGLSDRGAEEIDSLIDTLEGKGSNTYRLTLSVQELNRAGEIVSRHAYFVIGEGTNLQEIMDGFDYYKENEDPSGKGE